MDTLLILIIFCILFFLILYVINFILTKSFMYDKNIYHQNSPCVSLSKNLNIELHSINKLKSIELDNNYVVEVDDTVTVRYLIGEQNTREFVLSCFLSDPSRGIVNINAPLARELLGKKVNDEVEFLSGKVLRKVRIENLTKGNIIDE